MSTAKEDRRAGSAKRPQSSYGKRESSATSQRGTSASKDAKKEPAKTKNKAEKIERKNIDTEFKINKKTKVIKKALR